MLLLFWCKRVLLLASRVLAVGPAAAWVPSRSFGMPSPMPCR